MATATKPIFTQPPPELVETPRHAVNIVPFEIPAPEAYSTVYEPASRHRPDRILLGTLGDAGLRLLKPIPVDIEARADTIVSSWQKIDEFGTGTCTSSSAEDLGRTVAELYRSLQNDQDKLGPDLHRIWITLQEYVTPRR